MESNRSARMRERPRIEVCRRLGLCCNSMSRALLLLLLVASPVVAQQPFRQGDIVISEIGYMCGPPGAFPGVKVFSPDHAADRWLNVRSSAPSTESFGMYVASLAYQAETASVIAAWSSLSGGAPSSVVSLASDGIARPLLHPFSSTWVNWPVAIAPAASGGFYALWAVDYYPHPAVEVRHFDRFGYQTGAVPIAATRAIYSNWTLDVAADNCTVFYPTRNGTAAGRYDFCQGVYLPDFQLPRGVVESIRVLPDGGALIASGGEPAVFRFDAGGRAVWAYRLTPGSAVRTLALDPTGSSFYAGLDYPCNGWTLVRVNLATGVSSTLTFFGYEAPNDMAVIGEWRATAPHAFPPPPPPSLPGPRRRAAH